MKPRRLERHGEVFAELVRRNKMTRVEIAQYIGITTPNVDGFLATMEEQGYLLYEEQQGPHKTFYFPAEECWTRNVSRYSDWSE